MPPDNTHQRLDRLYASSQRAGFLKECTWTPANGGDPVTRWVNFSAPGSRRFDGLQAIAIDASVKFPTHWFAGIRRGDGITVDGKNYAVAEIMLVGDGSETEITLRKAQ